MSIVGDIVGGLAGGAASATPTGAITAVSNVVGKIIDWIHPDPAVAAQAKLKLLEMEQNGQLQQMTLDAGLLQGQMDINKIEASSSNLFVSGWRPFVGWTCGIGVAWAFLIQPALKVAAAIFAPELPPLPSADVTELMTLLGGLLGLAGIRSWDKRAPK